MLSVGNVCNAQTPPSKLSPDLQEVVKLSQSHMSDDVIVNYIRNSGKSYKLGADDIIYLSSQGVSQGVISALQTPSSANPNPCPGRFCAGKSAPTARVITGATCANPVRHDAAAPARAGASLQPGLRKSTLIIFTPARALRHLGQGGRRHLLASRPGHTANPDWRPY